MMRISAGAGGVAPLRWDDGGTPAALQVACVRAIDGWRCSCPASGRPELPETAASAIAPAFVVELAPSTRADVVRVVATGCTRAGRGGVVCAASADASHEAISRLEAAWALLPAMRALPPAALTVRGDVDVGTASLGVHNLDGGAGALALHVGGRVSASAQRVGAPAGATIGASLASGDAALQALSADRFFARYFGMGAATWAARPGVRRITCSTDCAATIGQAIAAGARLLVIDGDSDVAGPAEFGSAEDPVALVARGSLRLSGDIAVHGVVYGESIEWNDGVAGRALVRGAVLVANDYRGTAAVDVVRDEAVLARLAAASGSFVRVNGSWKDF